VRVWDVRGIDPPLVLKGHSDTVHAAVFAPSGRYLVTGGDDRSLRVWHMKERRLVRTVPCLSGCTALAFSPDGTTLASAGGRGEVVFWETATWSQRARAKGSDALVRDLRFSPDGLTLAVAGDDARIRLWETTTAQELIVLDGHATRVNALAFAPDGLTLASGSHDGAVKLWRAGRP
jgi:WD40 repeat protein